MKRVKIPHPVISSFKSIGILLRNTNKVDDDLKKEHTLPGNFIQSKVANRLFSNNTSGVLIRPNTRQVKHAYKKDVNSFQFNEKTTASDYERPSYVKDVHNIKNLRQKGLELEHRRIGLTEDKTTKQNEDKQAHFTKGGWLSKPYKDAESLEHTEVLFNLKKEDICGIYVCLKDKNTITNAFLTEEKLKGQYDYFIYSTQNGLFHLTDFQALKNLGAEKATSILSAVNKDIQEYIDSGYAKDNELSILSINRFLRGNLPEIYSIRKMDDSFAKTLDTQEELIKNVSRRLKSVISEEAYLQLLSSRDIYELSDKLENIKPNKSLFSSINQSRNNTLKNTHIILNKTILNLKQCKSFDEISNSLTAASNEVNSKNLNNNVHQAKATSFFSTHKKNESNTPQEESRDKSPRIKR